MMTLDVHVHTLEQVPHLNSQTSEGTAEQIVFTQINTCTLSYQMNS